MMKKTKADSAPQVVQVSLPNPVAAADPVDKPWRAECAKIVPGWEDMPEAKKRETASLMRKAMESRSVPEVKIDRSSGAVRISAKDGVDELVHWLRLQNAMGSTSMPFCEDALNDLVRHFEASNTRGSTETEVNAALAFIAGSDVENTVQARLALQMVTTHDAAMRAMQMVGRNPSLEVAPVFGNLAVKLLNAYTRQAETLAKLQRGGEQIVRHIHVDNRGGQAVITDQLVTGGQHAESGHQPHGQGAFSPALLGHDAAGFGMPVTSDEGQEAVPASRRAGDRRTKGKP